MLCQGCGKRKLYRGRVSLVNEGYDIFLGDLWKTIRGSRDQAVSKFLPPGGGSAGKVAWEVSCKDQVGFTGGTHFMVFFQLFLEVLGIDKTFTWMSSCTLTNILVILAWASLEKKSGEKVVSEKKKTYLSLNGEEREKLGSSFNSVDPVSFGWKKQGWFQGMKEFRRVDQLQFFVKVVLNQTLFFFFCWWQFSPVFLFHGRTSFFKQIRFYYIKKEVYKHVTVCSSIQAMQH